MVSWVWTYCKKIDNDFSSCNICLKRIARCGGTKSMISHLSAIHKITKDTDLANTDVIFAASQNDCVVAQIDLKHTARQGSNDESENEISQPSMHQRRSWVWEHFTCLDKEQSACHHCKSLMSHRHGTKGLVFHLKSLHSIFKPEQAENEDVDHEENGDENESKHQPGMSQKRSWSWEHYTLIDKQSASCNHCEKVLSCKDGTKGLISHLEALHSIITTAEPKTGCTPRNTSTRSWVWPYYTVIDKLSARCNFCRKVLARGGGTSGLMKHLQSQHDIYESSVTTEGTRAECDENSWGVQENLFDNFIEFPTISSFHKENCFVCNEKLTSCRTKLSFKTKLTSTALYKFLESFTGVELDRATTIDSSICHECFISFQQYDKWQHKSSVLQRKMTQMYRETHSEQINIKQEPNDNVVDDDNDRKRERDDDSDKDWWSEEPHIKRKRHSQQPEPCGNQNDDPKPSIDEESFCVTCSRRFKNPALFEIHLVTDHERSAGPFNCPKCSKSCTGLNSLKSHYLNHYLPRSLLCNKCGATFSKRRCLELHMQIHDDIRPYACTIPGCSKRFLHSFKLKCHLRVHSGEKIFECPNCPGRMFAQKWGMDLHIRKQHMNEPSQSGENEECKICGIRFNSKSKLKSHLENVHEVAPETPTEKTEYSSDVN